MSITTEQLREHLGGHSLICQVKEINPQKRKGRIEIFQTQTGQPWHYTHGQQVHSDMSFTYTGESKYKKDNWLLIEDYDLVYESLHSREAPQLKAKRIQLLSEVESLGELLKENSNESKDRQLSRVIRNVQLIGEKAFVLQQVRKKEAEEIRKEFAAEQEHLRIWEQEIRDKEEKQKTEQQNLRQEHLDFLAQCEAYYAERDKLQVADALLVERLQTYGLTPTTVETGQVQLTDSLIELLLAHEQVYERLKQTKLTEFAAKESHYLQWETKLNAQESSVRDRERQLDDLHNSLLATEQKVETRSQKLDRQEKKLRELQERLLPTTKVKQASAPALPFTDFVNEQELVTHIKDYIHASGFCYADSLIENFYTCLKTDSLVILSGISGAGKSTLPRLFAEAIGAQFELIPVRPDWNDDRSLLGFFNAREKRYQSTRFIEFLLRANEDPDHLYIVCLDEMNLAPVEYYFAQLLSVLETDEPMLNPPDETLTESEIDRFKERSQIKISRLLDERDKEDGVGSDVLEREIRLRKQGIDELQRYQRIPIPKNLRFVGTVNIDHTTHNFSDKVLDRANVIQFERVNLAQSASSFSQPIRVLNYQQQFAEYCKRKALPPQKETKLQEFVSHIRQIDEILESSGLNVGYRVLKKINHYMHYIIQSNYFGQSDIAFDLQIKQRILPKIRGMQSAELKESLEELAKLLEKHHYKISREKINGRQRNGKEYGGMIQQLRNKGYVNYWELR